MSQTTVSIRMDDDLKRNFDHICNELGMSMSTAVTMLAKKMTREQRLPFELSVDPFYSEQNMARLRKSIAEMEPPAARSTRLTWMIKAWTEEAWEDFEYWTTQDRRVLKRILQLLKDIDRNGYEGIGKPERLSGDLSNYWSRRIDDCNRIVYRIDGNVVKIVQCGSTTGTNNGKQTVSDCLLFLFVQPQLQQGQAVVGVHSQGVRVRLCGLRLGQQVRKGGVVVAVNPEFQRVKCFV